jgi:hypothetical protein
MFAGFMATMAGRHLSHDGRTPDSVLVRKIRYGFTIQNKSARLVENADFWAFAPVEQTAGQRCISVEASYPYKIIRDRMGNQTLWFKLEKIPPYGSRKIDVAADISFSAAANASSTWDPALFLGPETGIESDHPAIMEQSLKLTAETQIKTVTRFYTWVSKHIRYSGYSDASSEDCVRS